MKPRCLSERVRSTLKEPTWGQIEEFQACGNTWELMQMKLCLAPNGDCRHKDPLSSNISVLTLIAASSPKAAGARTVSHRALFLKPSAFCGESPPDIVSRNPGQVTPP
eukprot:Blabericola_migrator_1__6229@NODE_3142_length_2011_cov_6_886317_g419_i1_p1_GENE_NODE_3142_length_2011_cov_6_886317_g419_i1NODE_3142_length_2011_cov_6_886317_g419_i1_p1_ORF_typecomplete_len108_score12_66_NODE_3142_length_2011_cov_6_886317_g419_i115651888